MPRNVSHVAFERRIKVLNKSLFIRYLCFQQTALARVTMLTGVIQVILVLWFVTPCRSDVCSQKICQCTKFGGTRSWIHTGRNPKQYSRTVSDRDTSSSFVLQGLLSSPLCSYLLLC